MPRISPLAEDQVDQKTCEIYDLYLKEPGNVPHMFPTVAHRPEIFRTMIAHFRGGDEHRNGFRSVKRAGDRPDLADQPLPVLTRFAHRLGKVARLDGRAD
jgi:hypothetical protein